MTTRIVGLLSVGPLLALFASAANAQIGSGWQQFRPGSNIHLDGSGGIETSPGTITNKKNEGASFRKSGSVETFTIFDPISNRSERRMRNDYTSGRRQFQGEVRVSPPTNDESVMQIFGGRTARHHPDDPGLQPRRRHAQEDPGSVTLATEHPRQVDPHQRHPRRRTPTRSRPTSTASSRPPATARRPRSGTTSTAATGRLNSGSAKVEWRNVKHFRQSSGSNDMFALEDEGEEEVEGANDEAAPGTEERADDEAASEASDVEDPVQDDAAGDPAFGCTLGPASLGREPGWPLALVLALWVVRRSSRRRRGR